MLTIAKLFGKSPFAPLQTHMSKVVCCIELLPSLFRALLDQDMDLIDKLSDEISSKEHEADLTKNDIRNHLPRSLFLPVDRGALLEILSLQDSLADQSEQIAHLCQMRILPIRDEIKDLFSNYCSKNMQSFWLAKKVVEELEELLESSFGGIEAEKVKGMVEEIAFCEHEVAVLQNRLLKSLYSDDSLSVPIFSLFLSLIDAIGKLAKFSEKLGNRIRMLLELK